MKKIVVIILTISLTTSLKGTEQLKDLIIVNNDTFYLNTFPLHGTGLELQYQDTTCFSTGLYRGYWAHWRLEHDSLFLIKVISGNFQCSDSDPSKHIVFDNRLFASWYSDQIKLPVGEKLYCYTCIYPLYERHKIIKLSNGIVVSEAIQSNIERVEYYDQQDKVEKIKESLTDTLGAFLATKINPTYWNDLDCDETYILYFSKNGSLKFVTTEEYLYREQKKCLKILKGAIKDLDLTNYILPEQDFTIQLEVWYLEGKFEIAR